MSLKVYNQKRKFNQTPEPKGKKVKSGKGHLRFCVQMHSASRLHWDFRIEFDGVFKSWAVPKGPSLNPLDQRLAVFVEDHPLEYGSFEGIIPKGNYGAGTVMLWDEGTYVERGSSDRKTSELAMRKNFEKGHITFVLDGKKLKGEFALIKLKKDAGGKSWLMVKKRDEYSTYKRSQIPDNDSVKTGRTLEEIAAESEKAGDIWTSRKKKSRPLKRAKIIERVDKKQTMLSVAVPMPRKIRPMLPTISRGEVDAKGWLYESYNEGLRAIAEVEGKRVHLYSKSGLPFNSKFPEVVRELNHMDLQAVLDGEIVRKGKQAIYHVFDILYSNGRDLREQPLRERKKVLEGAFEDQRHVIHNGHLKGGPVVAKNLDSEYKSGTTSDWLLLEDARLVEKSEEPVKEKKKAKVAAKPKKYQPVSVGRDEARLTHPDKIYFPEDGITKGDVFEYYRKISPYILPYLLDRPESLNRHPNGINQAGFYQKDVTGYHPKWFKTERIFSESSDKSINYALIQDERSLLYVANLGCIELNPWFSRRQNLDKPDFLVIDLDPDDNDFDHVIEVAHAVHDLLEEIGAPSFVKTSGATGIHIGVPMAARYTFEEAKEFSEDVCKIIQKKFPTTTSVERSPNRRRKKIYLDFLQNRRGQTLAAPYCLRPKPGAPVSMPLTWKELKQGVSPSDFNIHNALARIKKTKDPWRAVLGPGLDLKKCLRNLEKKAK